MKANDQGEMRARGLTARLGFGDSPALLVVDFMRAFTDPEHPFGSVLDVEVEQTCRLLAAARSRRLPAIFTCAAYDAPDLADAGLWARKVPASASLRTGSADVALDARLERRDDEQLLVKKYASAFFGTDLASRLTTIGADTVLLAGCSTSGCVRATAVDALQHGFRAIVVREAVGDRNRAAHEQSLFDLDAKYADVVSVEDALAYLRGRGAERVSELASA
jgi:maleamate amidohydrolase